MIRTDEIGDLAMTLPLLTAMRETWPEARITLVAGSVPAELLRGTSLVDEVVTWTWLRHGQSTVLGQMRAWRFARQLKADRGRFDLAILPRRDVEKRGARLVAIAAATRVIGFDPADRRGDARESAERILLTLPVPAGRTEHHELKHLDRLGAASGVVMPADGQRGPGRAVMEDAGEELMAPIATATGPVIAVALGAGAAKRAWPARDYAAAVAAVHKKRPVRVLLLGGPADHGLGLQFVSALPLSVPVANAIGCVSLRQSVTLLTRCDLYLGGDTGTMHLASSVDTPSVVVSCHPRNGSRTSTNALNRFGPWSLVARTVQPETAAPGCTDECRAGHPHCITQITPEAVAAEVLELLDILPGGDEPVVGTVDLTLQEAISIDSVGRDEISLTERELAGPAAPEPRS